MTANVNLTAEQLSPVGGNTNAGHKVGLITAGAKAGQNDTWTVTNAKQIIRAFTTVDATGASGTHTISGNVITLTSETTGAHSALVIYR